MDSTKNEIYQYIKQISSKFSKDNAFMFSTQDICDKLRLSRNLTSQYLNQLQRENKLHRTLYTSETTFSSAGLN